MTTTESRHRDPAPRSAPKPAMSPAEQRSALVRLGMIVLAAIVAAAATGVTKTVAVIFAIIVMIMLHELGHFLTAKWADMKVTEYFLGFGPRLWSVRRGETEYGVKAIPAGGYVKIIGMSNLDVVDPEDEPRTYRQKPFWRRLSVAVAGSTMHFLIAFVLLLVLVSGTGIVQYDKPSLKVGEISKLATGQSPAQQAGFRVGDQIESIDGEPVRRWEDIPPYIRSHAGQSIAFVVRRGGQDVTLHATPVDLNTVKVRGVAPDATSGEPYGFVGIAPQFPVEKASPITGVGRSAKLIGSYTKDTVGALGHLVTLKGVRSYTDQLTGKPTSTTPSADQPRFISPVGLVRVASAAADNGLRDVLLLLVAINIFVGVFNMIPLLPLDGGHVAIAIYEKIRSRKGFMYHADVSKLLPLTYAVFLVLMFIGVSSLYLDIVRPLKLQ